jgi:hypothetical protein
MSVKFGEVRKNSGLDLNAKPFPALIVPLGGSNIIKIFGAAGLSPFDDKGILVIKELDGDAMIMDKYLVSSVPIAMAGIGGDPGPMYATLLNMALEIKLQRVLNPRFFQITGKALGGQVGTTVRVAKTQKSKADGSLRVVVLRPRPLKLSIRPVQIRNDKGSLVYHCERNYDAKALLNRINAVWTPQANIVFELASSDPAPLDDQAAIAKAVGSTSPKATVPPIIDFDDFSEMFQKLKDKEKPKADFTIFMVRRMTHGEGNAVYGTTNQKGGFALVSDDGRAEDEHTMPHEIGHYFGTLGKGSLYGDDNSSEDLLMSQGTDGTKVPFEDAIKYFNKSYK